MCGVVFVVQQCAVCAHPLARHMPPKCSFSILTSPANSTKPHLSSNTGARIFTHVRICVCVYLLIFHHSSVVQAKPNSTNVDCWQQRLAINGIKSCSLFCGTCSSDSWHYKCNNNSNTVLDFYFFGGAAATAVHNKMNLLPPQINVVLFHHHLAHQLSAPPPPPPPQLHTLEKTLTKCSCHGLTFAVVGVGQLS